MRALFVSWGWTSHYLPMVPLAWAFRDAGHEVLVATQPGFVPTVTGSGHSAIAVGSDLATEELGGRFLRKASPPDARPMEWEDLRSYGPRNCILFVAIAELMVDDLLATAQAWRPDLIVFEPTSYAAPVVATALGIPAARHVWGVDYTYLGREFEDEALAGLCARLGVTGVEPLGEVTVDPCPPSLQIAPTSRVPQPVVRLPMRHVAYNNRGAMPSRPRGAGDLPRVLVTWGGSSSKWDPRLDIGERVVRALADLPVEIVYATAGKPEPTLTARPNVHVERNVALDLLLPGCDLMVAHGGLGTMLTGVTTGVPQLTLPQIADQVLNARQLAATGAGDFAYAVDLDDEGLRVRVAAMLSDASYATAAGKLRDEAAALAGPAEVADVLAARYGGAR